MSRNTSRNDIVDIIRGLAMLLVVLGHTMSGCTAAFQDSVLFQVIWTLQMPLFIIISGYVTRYSRPLTAWAQLGNFIRKRSLAYLLPWGVWTFLVRGLLFDRSEFLDLKYIAWHMDSGYWFLVTIWFINIIYGFADFASNRIMPKNKYGNLLSHIAFCGLGMCGLGIIGYFAGLSFLGIKLTLYYIPFYLLGYVYGQIQDVVTNKTYGKRLTDAIVALALCLWLALILRFNFYTARESSIMIAVRFAASLSGCVALIGLLCNFTPPRNGSECSRIQWVGRHSLEIYLCHYLLLTPIAMIGTPYLMTLGGITILTVNFILTAILTCGTITVLQRNPLMNYLLFAKRTYSES